MGRSIVPILLATLTGCFPSAAEQASAANLERPGEALKALAAADPLLGSKLELDPSVNGTWWTKRGRWDDPSRRIKVDWGPLGLILYPSTLLELPGALISLPGSVIEAIFTPRESSKKDQLRRLGEEAAERAYPLEDRPPK